jgi:hypothetical protein
MVGSHGARLVNADISASAAIASSKLAAGGLFPKAFGGIYGPCDGGTCGWNVNSGFASTFTRSSAGQYTLTFAAARPNANYVSIVGDIGTGATPPYERKCSAGSSTTTTLGINCGTTAITGGSYQDWPFSVVVFDNDN